MSEESEAEVNFEVDCVGAFVTAKVSEISMIATVSGQNRELKVCLSLLQCKFYAGLSVTRSTLIL